MNEGDKTMIDYQPINSEDLKPMIYDIFKQQRLEYVGESQARNEDIISIGAYKDKQLVGGIIAHQQFQTLEIDYLAIQKGFRNLKIGSQLLEHVELLAQEKDIITITLNTLEYQAGAFYERHGYTQFAQLEDVPRIGDVRAYYDKRMAEQ